MCRPESRTSEESCKITIARCVQDREGPEGARRGSREGLLGVAEQRITSGSSYSLAATAIGGERNQESWSRNEGVKHRSKALERG